MEIMNIKELSKYLKVSVSTVRRLILKREIPYYRVSNQLFFNTEIINDWIKNKIQTNSERSI